MTAILDIFQQSVARALYDNMYSQVGCKRLARVPGEVFSAVEAEEREIDMREMAQSAIETTIRGLIADGASEAMVQAWQESTPADGDYTDEKCAAACWHDMLLAKARELGINVEGMG